MLQSLGLPGPGGRLAPVSLQTAVIGLKRELEDRDNIWPVPGVPAAPEAEAGGSLRLALATQQKPFLKGETKPVMMVRAFSPSTLEAEANRSLLEATLVYRGRSRTVRTTERDPVSKRGVGWAPFCSSYCL